jgi:hypothetical protein
VKSGPDVFADALVPCAAPMVAGAPISRIHRFILTIRGLRPRRALCMHRPDRAVPHSRSSPSAKADDPVFQSVGDGMAKLWRTGYPRSRVGRQQRSGTVRCTGSVAAIAARSSRGAIAPMVIVLRNGKVNRIRPLASNPRETSAFAIHGCLRRQRIYVPFIAMIKLPFKFDRS